ncbi:MAG: hypothetical protein LBN95_03895 [Prevotellaceae bacterium]|jgi:hypothetical protein|nr:hypothetical protein [Prevotellaceae bacterium]
MKTCKGGRLYDDDEVINCKECAMACSGCIEMVINLGYQDYYELCHLITLPQNLSKSYRKIFDKKCRNRQSLYFCGHCEEKYRLKFEY